MRRALVAVGGLAIALALVLALPGSEGPLAQAGCCKTRESYRDTWTRTPQSFAQCKALNERRDKDDVFEERGFVWWDLRCAGR